MATNEFIEELKRIQAEQEKLGGFNAPAPEAPGLQPQTPMVQPESVFNAPAAGVAAPDAITMATPAVQAPQGQVPMLGGFEVRGAGSERFALGTPEVAETLFSSSYRDPKGNTAAIQAAQSSQADAQVDLQSAEAERQRINQATQDRIDTRNEVGTNLPDLFRSAVPYIKEGIGMAQSAGEGIAEFVTGKDIEVPKALDLRMYDATPAAEAAAEKQRLSDQMIPAAPLVDPFGVTPTEIAAAGNQNFGQAVPQAQPENPYRTQYGVNSLNQGAIDEIKQQNAQETQAQIPSNIQNASGQGLMGFKPKYEGQTLTDFMAGRDDPSAASVQVQDPQGRFRRQAAPVIGETPEQNQSRTDALFPEQADFQQASTDREARQAARQDFGEAQTRAAGTVTDRERRTARGEGMSDADRRDIAKSNMRGASASDIARGDKVAGLNGINRITGESLVTGLTPDQQLNLRKQEFTEAKTILDWKKADEVTKTKRTDEMNTEIAALTSAMDQGKTVQDVGERAQRGANWKTAGFLSPLRFIGGTDAAALEGNLETIKADAFVSNITDMRNNSPTGGSVGNVSDKDLLQMQSLQRSFQQKQKPEDLKRNIAEYLQIRNRVIERTSERFTRNYGQENFDKYFGKNAEGASSTSGSSTAIPNDRNVAGKADLYLLPSSK